MLRYVVYFFGGSMLLEGILGLLAPRSGPILWRRYLSNLMPTSLNRVYADYSSLSNSSIRYLSAWVTLFGVLFLALANLHRGHVPELESDEPVLDYQI